MRPENRRFFLSARKREFLRATRVSNVHRWPGGEIKKRRRKGERVWRDDWRLLRESTRGLTRLSRSARDVGRPARSSFRFLESSGWAGRGYMYLFFPVPSLFLSRCTSRARPCRYDFSAETFTYVHDKCLRRAACIFLGHASRPISRLRERYDLNLRYLQVEFSHRNVEFSDIVNFSN